MLTTLLSLALIILFGKFAFDAYGVWGCLGILFFYDYSVRRGSKKQAESQKADIVDLVKVADQREIIIRELKGTDFLSEVENPEWKPWLEKVKAKWKIG